MRHLFLALCLLATSAVAQTAGSATVCLVPGPDDCAALVVDEIGKAQHMVDMQAYGFTEPQIAQAVLDAHERGVVLRLISDKTEPLERGGKAVVLAMAGIPVWVDYVPRIAHNKVIVLDGQIVVTGSFDRTVAADRRNAENLLILDDPGSAAAYEANIESRLKASESLNQYEARRGQ